MRSLSIVCVFNNHSTLEANLLQSLREQAAEYQLILLDNAGGKFNSAARALNHGSAMATGDYLLFIHQDVRLGSQNVLTRLLEMVESLPFLGVAGLAGAADTAKRGEVTSNITHGSPPRRVGSIHPLGPVRAQTIDECCFVVPRSVFALVQFDESVCDDWHLYAVDYCLTVAGLGLRTYVLPLPAHHASTGRRSEEYYTSLAKLLDKHRPNFTRVHTTTGVWSMKFTPPAQEKIGLIARGLRKVSARMGNRSERVDNLIAYLGNLCYTPPR